MIVPASSAKAAPTIMPPLLAVAASLGVEGHFLLQIIAVIAGVGFGAMWRAGSLRAEGKDWAAIRSDMLVSLLIGGGNSVLALGLAEIFSVGILLAMTIGVIIGATGLRALPAIREELANIVSNRVSRRQSRADFTEIPPPE